ncbi:MAG: pseudouridine synthase [Ignavibacteriae bacterium HGW-Ignavibacteriae-3]|nr:MAG: pseudouridine synthase [Ignavibacteriae bacterium HGW-Ignavibacteriae-3]
MNQSGKKYFIVNKPYGVLSQFTDKNGRPVLSGLYKFPKDVYPVGRLDFDSEGLLLLTNDKTLTDYLLNPKNRHEREYYVQVENIPVGNDLKKLRDGIILKEGKTLPAKVKIIDCPDFQARVPQVRQRKNIPTCWLSLTLTEGRNRQVRRMTAAIGFPTLRLVRVRIKNIALGDLRSGEVRKLLGSEIESLKKYPPPERRIKF